LVQAARRQSAYYLEMYAAALEHPSVVGVLGGERLPLRQAVRSAAVRACVAHLYRDRLQNLAAWLGLPLVTGVTFATIYLILTVPNPGPRIITAAITTTVAVLATALSLVMAVLTRHAMAHFIGSIVLAAVPAVGILGLSLPQGPARLVLVGCVAPLAMYLAFTPLMLAAYMVARHVGTIIDPRARIVLGLLACLHATATRRGWLHKSDVRDQITMALERVARIADHDLPRILVRRARDDRTQEWLRARCRSIAARVRESKQRLLFPEETTGTEFPAEVAGLLLHACRDEWDRLEPEHEAADRSSLTRTLLRHIGLSLILFAAAIVIPRIASVLPGDVAQHVRNALLITGVLALVPVPREELRRIPDVFQEMI
jgi:hypothetical protein